MQKQCRDCEKFLSVFPLLESTSLQEFSCSLEDSHIMRHLHLCIDLISFPSDGHSYVEL